MELVAILKLGFQIRCPTLSFLTVASSILLPTPKECKGFFFPADQWKNISVGTTVLFQNASFSQCASMSQDCLIFHQQSPLPTQGTVVYPTFKPPLHTTLLFLLTLHPGGQTSEPTDFLTTFAHIIIRSSHLRDTMSPRGVVTQETRIL